MRGAGRDATDLFRSIHSWVNPERMLAKCIVGKLVESRKIGRDGDAGERYGHGHGYGDTHDDARNSADPDFLKPMGSIEEEQAERRRRREREARAKRLRETALVPTEWRKLRLDRKRVLCVEVDGGESDRDSYRNGDRDGSGVGSGREKRSRDTWLLQFSFADPSQWLGEETCIFHIETRVKEKGKERGEEEEEEGGEGGREEDWVIRECESCLGSFVRS